SARTAQERMTRPTAITRHLLDRGSAWGDVSARCNDVRMKRSTAIKRLGDVAEGLDRSTGGPGRWTTPAQVHGALLDGATEFDWLDLAFVVDEPAESVPWMSRPAHLEGL